MTVAPETLHKISEAFLRAHDLAPQAEQMLSWQLGLAAELLPEPQAHGWTVTGSSGDGDATLLILTTDALFTLTTEFSGAQRPPLLNVASHQVRVTGVTYSRDGRRTHWNFERRDQDPLMVDGRIGNAIHAGGPEPFDQAEAFARALANRAGWDTPSEASLS